MHYINSKSILSSHNGMNIYRGCQHGCIYCDSRSKCYMMDHEFTDVAVKENAIKLLEDKLSKKRTKGIIGFGSMSDPYMPLESKLEYTKRALEVIYKYGFGVSIITKSDLILRDLELLKKINSNNEVIVNITLTTKDVSTCKIIEPFVCDTKRRIEVLNIMHDNNIKTVVWLCPILPFINDSLDNLKYLLEECKKAHVFGIIYFGAGLTLREGNREYFYEQLDKFYPTLKDKYIKNYGNRYELRSPNANILDNYFYQFCKSNNIICDNNVLFSNNKINKMTSEQTSLF